MRKGFYDNHGIIQSPFSAYNISIMKLLHRINFTKGFFFIFVLIGIVLSFFPLRTLTAYLSWPYPIEYRDAVALDAAIAIHDDINIYSVQDFPKHIYVYGPLFPLAISFCMNFLDPSFQLLYTFDLIFFFLSLAVMIWLVMKNISSKKMRWTAILFTFFTMIVFAVENFSISGTRPSFPGLFFLLLTIVLAEQTNYSTKGLILSAVSAFIAFNFKQYFLVGFPVVCLSLFFFRSKKKGILYGVITSAIMAGLVALISIRYPLYLNSMFWHHYTATVVYDYEHMLFQLIPFLIIFWFLFSGIFMAVPFSASFVSGIDIRHFSLPLLKERSKNSIFLLSFFVALFCFMGRMGCHPGNTYTYFIDLVLPFLLLVPFLFFDQIAKSSSFAKHIAIFGLIPIISALVIILITGRMVTKISWCAASLLIILAVYCLKKKLDPAFISVFLLTLSLFGSFVFGKPRFITKSDLPYAPQEKLSEALSSCKSIYMEAPGFAYALTHKDDVKMVDNGHYEVRSTLIYSKNKVFSTLFPGQSEQMSRQLAEMTKKVRGAIENQSYDCILDTPSVMDPLIWLHPEFYDYYEQKGSYPLLSIGNTSLFVPKK